MPLLTDGMIDAPVVLVVISAYALGVDTNGWAHYNADQYYQAASQLSLGAFPNGGSAPPAPNDMAVFEGGPAGHVAIVTDVSLTDVHIIEQNWSFSGVATLSLNTIDGHYTGSRPGSHYVVLSWLRSGTAVATWTRFTPNGFGPRVLAGYSQSTAYDAANDRFIVFGGEVASNPCCLESNDTWVLINASGSGGVPTWQQLSPAAPRAFPQRDTITAPFTTQPQTE